jgi:hypothetical protein
MTNRTLLFLISVLTLMTLGSSCRTPDVGCCDATSKERLLNIVITGVVDFPRAYTLDALTYLGDEVERRSGGESLNLMVLTGDWETHCSVRDVSYEGTNVTVRAVLREVVRQTGLRTEFIAGAVFVGTPDTLHRIRKFPPFPSPRDRTLAARLEHRLEIWQGCQEQLSDTAMYLKRVTGVTLDVKEASHKDLPFAYRADIRNMRLKNFLWWLAVLSDSEVSLVDDTVKFTLRRPNHASVDIRRPAAGASKSSR